MLAKTIRQIGNSNKIKISTINWNNQKLALNQHLNQLQTG